MTLEVVALAGFGTVQDGGRPGRMHEGVPPGGPLVPELLARANAAVGNDYTEPAIELVGSMTLVSDGPAFVATCDGDTRHLVAGEPWAIAAGVRGAPRYVAFRGGVDVPEVLGGRGTLVVAGLGGHEGRPLRKGDRLRTRSSAERSLPLPSPPDLDAPILVVLGPDDARFAAGAIDTLLGSPFAVHALRDRAGMRLSGPPLARADGDTGVSAPMIRGAIQVPASGEAIVLGPDHPTTGGYPVIATVVRSCLGSLAARPPGAAVRFALAPASLPQRATDLSRRT
jgi:biotin-dependent carboxylase-like uncharacterized protein